MAYLPNTWATNDVVTVEKLNHIENGISAAESKINSNLVAKKYFDIDSNYHLNQTLGSIVNSFLAGIPVQVVKTVNDDQDDDVVDVYLVEEIYDLDHLDDIYTTKTITTSGGYFYANSPDEYPIIEGGE